MRIFSVKIENFRSIANLELSFDGITALVGSNNAGKSTVLKAIELFFDSAPRITASDHFMHDVSKTISISLEFGNLVATEEEEFSHALSDGVLRVAREFGGPSSENGDYFVYAKVCDDFQKFRDEKNGTNRRSHYAELRRQFGLPAATGDDMEIALKSWEQANASALRVQKVRGFFGAKNVANGKIVKKTSVRLVPAVKDTSDEVADAKKSPVIGLLAEIVRQTFENKKEFSEFVTTANERLAQITDPSQVPQLSGISDKLTRTLNMYYADTGLIADLNKANDLVVNFPSPSVNVLHRGLRLDVGQVGHGLQRAILFSLVQFLAEEQAPSSEPNEHAFIEPQSDIILLVEEPEIYQHPLKQSLFYDAFRSIAEGYSKASGIRIQIIYTTHSEKFINIVEVDKLRLISKRQIGEQFETSCKSLTIKEFSAGMAALFDTPRQPLSDDSFKIGLHIFSREVSEAFFADKAILVEGVSDREILRAAFMQREGNPSHFGVAIVQLDGKTKIDKPLFALSRLGIPAYPVFDNDSDKKGKERENAIKRNHLIQKIVGCTTIEQFPSGFKTEFSAFEGNLEKYLKAQLGDLYDQIRAEICEHFHVSAGEACKSPAVVSGMLVKAKAEGIAFELLDQIVDRVSEM